VTVLAVATAHVVGSRDHTRPDRSRRSLRDRLELEGCLTLGREIAVCVVKVIDVKFAIPERCR
jgi:hypothetical protein